MTDNTPRLVDAAANLRDQLQRKHAVYLTLASVMEMLYEAGLSAAEAQAAHGAPSDTERDAARYRWLRERVNFWRTSDGNGAVVWFPVTKVPASSSPQDETDAAIDWSILRNK